MELNYNFVIFGYRDDYYRIVFRELNENDSVVYLGDKIDVNNFFIKKINCIHTSAKINSLFELPFQGIWYRYAFRRSFNNNKPICFVFLARNYLLKIEAIKYLRERHPFSKFVIYWTDLYEKTFINNIELIREMVDLCISYDKADATQYHMLYRWMPYSRINTDIINEENEKDVFFVGKAKDRLKKIISCYEYLKAAGLSCDFWIIGVEKGKMKYSDDIHYNKRLTYFEVVQHLQKCRAVLEIMQGDAIGYTLRTAETIIYEKKLITDNQEIKRAEFYQKDQILVFKKTNEIDVSWITQDVNFSDKNYKKIFSPFSFVKFIDQALVAPNYDYE